MDETLLEIRRLAHAVAHRLCRADIADDVAQEVVLKCVEQIRAGQWGVGGSSHQNLPGFVRHMVKCQRIDVRRARAAATRREAAFEEKRGRRPVNWSAPDLAFWEREVNRLLHEVLDALPWTCGVAYVLVRDRKRTHEQAAEYLGVDVSTVRANMVRIRPAFREHLLNNGIQPPPPTRGRATNQFTR